MPRLLLILATLFLFSTISIDAQQHEESLNASCERTAHSEVSAERPILFLLFALLLGITARFFFQKTHLPYTVILLIAGLLLGILVLFESTSNNEFVQSMDDVAGMDPHVIMFVFLPILVFESSFSVDVHVFKKNFWQILILATLGVLINAALGAVLVKFTFFYFEPSWLISMMVGAILSATDPVAVVALLKELGASKKLGTLIEGESLLNDGTAFVLYTILTRFVYNYYGSTEEISAGLIIWELVRIALGGPLLGYIVGVFMMLWTSRVFEDQFVEITITIMSAYLTFFIAEKFLHVSGILAVVALGVYMNYKGKTNLSAVVQHFLHNFWGMMSYLANTLIFVIVGVTIVRNTVLDQDWTRWVYLLVVYVALQAIRAFSVMVLYPLLRRTGYGLDWKGAVILTWGGLRGAVGLILALIVLNDGCIDGRVRQNTMFVVAGIVVLSLIVNGSTTEALMSRMKMNAMSPAQRLMESRAIMAIEAEMERTLDTLKGDKFLRGANWEWVREKISLVRQTQQKMKKRRWLASSCKPATKRKKPEDVAKEKAQKSKKVKLSSPKSMQVGPLDTFEDEQRSGRPTQEEEDVEEAALGTRGKTSSVRMTSLEDVHTNGNGKQLDKTRSLSPVNETDIQEYGDTVERQDELVKISHGTSAKFDLDENAGPLRLRRSLEMIRTPGDSEQTEGEPHRESSFMRSHTFVYNQTAHDLERQILIHHATALKSSYWRLYKQDLLSGDSYQALLEAAERSVDQMSIYSGHKILEEKIVIPQFILRMMEIPLIGVIARKITNSIWTFRYELALGFVIASRDAITVMDSELTDNDRQIVVSGEYGRIVKVQDLLDRIKTEFHSITEQTMKSVNSIEVAFPNVAQAIKSRQAAKHILYTARKLIDVKKKNGQLDEDEGQRLANLVEESIKKLVFSPMEIKRQDNKSIIRQYLFHSPLPESFLQSVADAAKHKIYEAHQTIIREGEQSKGICIVTAGIVQKLGFDGVEYTGAGTIIGDVAFLSGTPSNTTVKTDTIVETLWLYAADIRRLISVSKCQSLKNIGEIKPGLTFQCEDNDFGTQLWRKAAIRLGVNLLRRREPYSRWGLERITFWLNRWILGEPNDKITYRLGPVPVIIISGSITRCRDGTVVNAPGIADHMGGGEVKFGPSSHVLVCPVSEAFGPAADGSLKSDTDIKHTLKPVIGRVSTLERKRSRELINDVTTDFGDSLGLYGKEEAGQVSPRASRKKEERMSTDDMALNLATAGNYSKHAQSILSFDFSGSGKSDGFVRPKRASDDPHDISSRMRTGVHRTHSKDV